MAVELSNIQLDAQTARALSDYAAALGLTVQEFLRKHFAGSNGLTAIDDVDGWLDELAEGSDEFPPLPRDFSSSDIYADTE